MKMLILRGKAGYMRTGTGRERGFARATGARLRDAPRLWRKSAPHAGKASKGSPLIRPRRACVAVAGL